MPANQRPTRQRDARSTRGVPERVSFARVLLYTTLALVCVAVPPLFVALAAVAVWDLTHQRTRRRQVAQAHATAASAATAAKRESERHRALRNL